MARGTNIRGSGTQTAALTAGGYSPAKTPNFLVTETESWNGTTWTEVNDLNQGRNDTLNLGTQTASIQIGGGIGPVLQIQLLTWNFGMVHLGQIQQQYQQRHKN